MLSELATPLHLLIALGPLAVYLLLLGAVNISSRPRVTSGPRDAAALGVGISGIVLMGPVELFVPLLPSATIFLWGPFLWLMLLALYGLTLTLIVLLMRPRLVIYNIRSDQVRPMLANLVSQLDPEARWAGECLSLPTLGIQLHVETHSAMRNVQLIAAGARQSYEGWWRLQSGLAQSLKQTKTARSPLGFCLIISGLLMIAAVSGWIIQDHQTVAQSLDDVLSGQPDE